MSYEYLAVMAIFALFCSFITGRIERIPISGPILFIAFGAAVVAQTMAAFDWRILLYAILSLTLVRMLPIFVSLPVQMETFGTGWLPQIIVGVLKELIQPFQY